VPRQALPLYLEPEEHAALRDLSVRTGRSMSDLVRDAVRGYLAGEAPPTDLSMLAGAVELGHPTDISRQRDDLLDKAARAVR
jgi:hypothetical protein